MHEAANSNTVETGASFVKDAPVTVVTEWLSETTWESGTVNRARGASPLASGRSLSLKIVVKNSPRIEESREDVGSVSCPSQALEVEHRIDQCCVDIFTPHSLCEVNFTFTLESSSEVRSAPLAQNIRIVRRGTDTDSTSCPGKRVAQVVSLET